MRSKMDQSRGYTRRYGCNRGGDFRRPVVYVWRQPLSLFLVEIFLPSLSAAHFMARSPTTLPRRHGTFSECGTVGRGSRRPRDGFVARFFSVLVHDLGLAPSLAVTHSEVATLEASWCPPLVHGVIICVVVHVLGFMVFRLN